jgi:hypothetical protein
VRIGIVRLEAAGPGNAGVVEIEGGMQPHAIEGFVDHRDPTPHRPRLERFIRNA